MTLFRRTVGPLAAAVLAAAVLSACGSSAPAGSFLAAG
jgi:hypothetical protein